MPTLVRVTVEDQNINRIFLPGGDAWDWMRKVGQEQMFITLEQTPVRSGELRRSFNLALTPNGANNVRYTVGTYSEHAVYVIFGTTPPIWGDGNAMAANPPGPLMLIRPSPHSWSPHPFWKRLVDGQMANDFMGRAGAVIYARYG